MAAVVVAGIPWLAGVLGTLFSGTVAWFAQFITKKLAIVAAAITVMVGLTAALFVASTALVTSVYVTLPSSITAGISIVLPENIHACVGVLVTARILNWAYDWQTKFIGWKVGAV